MYSISLLKDREFDKLPYKDVDQSLGLADYRNKKAYVRESGIPALDLLIMGHEIQELVADVSPHEENGIRYKKGGAARSIVPWIVGAIGTLIGGPGLGAVLGGLSGGGMGAYAGANHPAELGGPLQSGLWGAASGALGGYGAGKLLQGGMAGWSSAAGKGLGSQLGSAAHGALFGSAGAAGAAQGPVTAAQAARGLTTLGGGATGLLGQGSLLGSIGSSTMGQMGMLSAGNTLMNNFNSQVANINNPNYNQTVTNDNFVPNSYYSFNSAIPYPSTVQSIKSTPSLTGFSSSLMNSYPSLFGQGATDSNSIVPGIQQQKQSKISTFKG